MNSVEKVFFKLIFSIAIIAGLFACGKSNGVDPDPTPGPAPSDQILTNIASKSTVLCAIGDEVSITATGAQTTDVIVLASGNTSLDCEISNVAEKSFKFVVPEGVVNGTKYGVSIRRGDVTQKLFDMTIFLQSVNTNVPDKAGMNLKGMVYCGSKGVADVLVTDGVNFTKTDSNGHYWLNSDKRYEVVYIVLPSGYDVKTQAAKPLFWASTSTDTKTCEQFNFELEANNNDNHTILVATDIHLTNRTSLQPHDFIQFKEGWVKEVTSEYAGKPNVYCLNLGDFSQDIYWYQYNCDLTVASSQISGLPFQFWSTMGNHDNDGHTPAGDDVDFRASGPYRHIMGPTHISMNIGKVHYILIDDIIYLNDFPGTTADVLMGKRNYNAGFREDILEWVKQDLSYVDKSTPILIGMHIPLCDAYGNARNGEFRDENNWKTFIDMFADFNEVDFITGHTHVNRMRPIPGYGTNMYEHNIGAVCGIWWNTSSNTGGTSSKPGKLAMCSDGSPTCYYVYDVTGTKREWHLKGVGVPESKQFKSYDMNEIKKFFDNYAVARTFIEAKQSAGTNNGEETTISWTAKEYGYEEEPNTVLINVWGYERGAFANHGNWSISVREGNTELPVEQVDGIHDPLSALTYEISEYNVKKKFSTSSQSRKWHTHLFKVKASSATSTLKITVTDRFGNVYYEEMKRPKTFYTGTISDSWTLD